MSDRREEGTGLVRGFAFVHGWNKVRLSLSTHSAAAATQADHDLAAGIDGPGVG